jgi:hypothetical protein
MVDRESLLKEHLLQKPECVIALPQWMLSENKIEKYRAISKGAILEIAGRDSIAAAILFSRLEGITDLIPTYVYTGTEFGPWSAVRDAVNRLERSLPGVRIHDLLVLGSPRFWRALNGRFISALISRYGCYMPCVGCHLYLHVVRIPLSVALGNVPIIAGEREKHDGNIKVNQITEALDGYQVLADTFGVRIVFPLRRIDHGSEIEALIGSPWKEGKGQLDCVLSGNYKGSESDLHVPVVQILQYLREFAVPCAREVVSGYLAGKVPDHIEIAERILNPKGIEYRQDAPLRGTIP